MGSDDVEYSRNAGAVPATRRQGRISSKLVDVLFLRARNRQSRGAAGSANCLLLATNRRSSEPASRVQKGAELFSQGCETKGAAGVSFVAERWRREQGNCWDGAQSCQTSSLSLERSLGVARKSQEKGPGSGSDWEMSDATRLGTGRQDAAQKPEGQQAHATACGMRHATSDLLVVI